MVEPRRECSIYVNISRMRIVDLTLQCGFVVVYRRRMHSDLDLLILR